MGTAATAVAWHDIGRLDKNVKKLKSSLFAVSNNTRVDVTHTYSTHTDAPAKQSKTPRHVRVSE